MIFDHLVPLLGVAFLVGQPLGIDPVCEDHRIVAVRDRAEDVGAQHEAIASLDPLVPSDLHAVPYLRAGLDLSTLSHCVSPWCRAYVLPKHSMRVRMRCQRKIAAAKQSVANPLAPRYGSLSLQYERLHAPVRSA